MKRAQSHITWLALPLALLANLLWFGLLAAAQQRTPPPIPVITIPEAHIIYEAARLPQPATDIPAREYHPPVAANPSAAVTHPDVPSAQPWPLPSPRLNPHRPAVSLPALAPPSLLVPTSVLTQAGADVTAPSVDRMPLMLSGDPPSYPWWAKRSGLTGQVQLRFVVSRAGRVQDIEIIHVKGDTRFGAHAAHKVSSWRFDPARKNGRAVAYRCFQTIHFRPRINP